MKEWYRISRTDLLELLQDSAKLAALEGGGVDNWDWYSEALHDFLDSESVEGFYDFAEREIEYYEPIEF